MHGWLGKWHLHRTESLIAAEQEAVLSAGCIPALIKLASSANDELRLNAVWALQNLVYQASTDVRKALLDALSWRHAMELLSDMRSEVQVRPYVQATMAQNLLRCSESVSR